MNAAQFAFLSLAALAGLGDRLAQGVGSPLLTGWPASALLSSAAVELAAAVSAWVAEPLGSGSLLGSSALGSVAGCSGDSSLLDGGSLGVSVPVCSVGDELPGSLPLGGVELDELGSSDGLGESDFVGSFLVAELLGVGQGLPLASLRSATGISPPLSSASVASSETAHGSVGSLGTGLGAGSDTDGGSLIGASGILPLPTVNGSATGWPCR